MKISTSKITATLLSLIMICTLAPVSSVYAETNDNQDTVVVAEELISEDNLDDEVVSAQSDGERQKLENGDTVNIGDVEVVYEDGTPVEDGVKFDLIDMVAAMSGGYSNIQYPERYKKVYTVKDGKLSGMTMIAERQYKIGFDTDNEYWSKLDVVGAYNSKKLMRIFARYEGEVPLWYDYDEGIDGEEIPVSRLVIHKLGEDEEAVSTRPTSCIMQLLLVEGTSARDSQYYAEGKHKFKLTRTDNGKSKTLWSNGSELTIIGDANVPYVLSLVDDDMYEMKDINFHILLDSYDYYQAVRDGYDKDNEDGYLTYDYTYLKRIDGKDNSEKNPIYSDDGDDSSYELVYREDTVTMKSMKVMEATSDSEAGTTNYTDLDKSIEFVFYNASKQCIEQVVKSENGAIPEVELIRGQHYIVYANDTEYSMSNYYITLRTSGEYATCDKCGSLESAFYLTKRETPLEDTSSVNRVNIQLPVYATDSNGDTAEYKTREIKFVLTSPLETVEAVSSNGILSVDLLEDNNYMVSVEDSEYAIRSFPMTVKDKSEYGSGKYAFNHLSCGSVSGLFLIAKADEHKSDNYLVSNSGNTSVTGINFGNGSYILAERTLDMEISELAGKGYKVIEVDCINLYRTEISKLAKGDFEISHFVDKNKKVQSVYYIDADGKLQPVEFSQKNEVVTFEMKSMSMYNNVIVYADTASLSKTSYTYNGKAQKPVVTVRNGNGDKLTNGKDYTVTYNNNKQIGTGQAIVSFADGSDAITLNFIINPAATTIKKVAKKSAGFKMTWNKKSNITGYQIRYSKKSSMNGAKTVKVSKLKTSYTAKKLSKKTKYYVQIRTYKIVNGKTYTSAWSTKKVVKTK